MDTQFVQRTHTIISVNSIKGKADFTLKMQIKYGKWIYDDDQMELEQELRLLDRTVLQICLLFEKLIKY